MKSITQHIPSAWRERSQRVASRLFLDRHVDLWLRELDSVESRGEIRARVVEVILEADDTRTFVLAPNRRWPGHRAGQWTRVEVEIDGVRARRCYSISSAPEDPRVAITVKRVPGGRVSGWLHDHLRIGDVLTLSEPGGDFVLPAVLPPRLLMLAGGSGITPLMSMLRALDARAERPDVVLVHHARTRGAVIFRYEIAALAARWPSLRHVLCLDDEPRGAGGFDEARLASLVPDLASRETFLCGPPAMMERAEAMWRARGMSARLHQERFSAPRVSTPQLVGQSSRVVEVRLTRAGRSVQARTSGTLLDELERGAERPAAGCRMGICHTCTCLKRSGSVRNLLTGAVSSADDEDIQLCVSVPLTDVELSL